MREAGCVQVNIGVESGSERIRRLIRKECSLERIEETFRLIKKVGIEAVAYFMFGFPTETKEDMEKTLSLMRKIEALPCVSLATPYPGTEMWKIGINDGRISEDLLWESHFHHSPELPNISEVSPEDLIGIANRADNLRREYLRKQGEENLKKRVYDCLSSLYSDGMARKIAVFGAGRLGLLCLKYLSEFDVEVVAVVDNDLAKQGIMVEGFKVLPPSVLDKLEMDEILVASTYFHEIYSNLQALKDRGIKIQGVLN